LILEAPERAVFECLEEEFGNLPRNDFLMGVDLGGLGGALLEVAPFCLVGAALPYGFDALGLN
jgi:hypothetical protein